MSKKMLKRSLALGALMAFVITGSAMAEEEIYITSSNVDSYVFDSSDGIDLTNYQVSANTGSDTSDKGNIRVYGINIEGSNGSITLKDMSKLTVTATDDYATSDARSIRLNGNNVLTAEQHITLNATTDEGQFAIGLGDYSNDTVNIKNGITIEATNNNKDNKNGWDAARAIGMAAEGDSTINVYGTADISAYGSSYNQGVYNSLSNITFNDVTEIVVESERKASTGYQDAVAVQLESSNDSTADTVVTFKDDVTMKIDAKEGYAMGVMASGSSRVKVDFQNSDVNINVKGKSLSEGLVAKGDGKIIGDENSSITLEVTSESGNAYGIVSRNYNDKSGEKYGIGDFDLQCHINISVIGATGSWAIYNYVDEANETNHSTVVGAEGKKVVINGDVYAGSNTITTTLGTSDSKLTGAVTTVDGATTTLNMVEGATWDVTGNSVITNVEGNGTIKLDMVSEDAVATVDATSISKTTTVGATSTVTDYLAGLSGEEQTEAMKKVVESVQVDGEAVTGTITTDEGMVTGAYTLRVNEDGSVDATQKVNTKSDAVSDAGMALKAHWRAHMNDMNKRMGDLRMANGETGVWTRMVRGESEYQGAKMQYNQYQLGYDEKLSVDKRWTVGAAVTFSEGDASYGYGSTDDKSTAFAIYGSKLNNDGTFVDLIARYAHLESDLDDNNYGTGDYSTNGMSVSAEFGKRIEQGNGLWIEPQVELTYGTVDSANVAFSNGYKAHYDSMDSFIARAGFALGKDIKQGNVYARASYLYDFDGESTTTFANGGQPIEEDFGGGWWEVGVGANINLSKATYIYADVEKTFGGEVDTNWQWNLGVRYSF